MKLAILTSHPIQYQAPLFRELARRPGVDLTVLFCHDHGVGPSFDEGFGQVVQFDVPLLEGYRSRFLDNRARAPSLAFTGMINPEIVTATARGTYDALMVYGWGSVTKLLALVGPHPRTRILVSGDSNELDPAPGWKRSVKRIVLGGLFRRVDGFVAVGTLNAAFYRSHGADPARITLAPYAVDNDYFAARSAGARERPSAVRKRLGLPADVPIFLASGKLQPHKRPLDVVRAFARARREGRCALAFVGDGEQRAALLTEADRLGVKQDVVLLGFRNQSELPEIYGACDALVLASEIEPWGLVVNEALASGMGVVVADHIGCSRDLVEPEAMFPVGDIQALHAILSRLASDPAHLATLKQKGQRRIQGWGIREAADGVIAAASGDSSASTAPRRG